MTTLSNRRKNFIAKLQTSSGSFTEDHEEMKCIAVNHFQNAFSTQDHFIDDCILDCIPNMITMEDNSTLCAVPSASEIKTVVDKMSSDSAPG